MTISPIQRKPVYAGLSISRHVVELAIFSPKTMAVTQAVSAPVPDGVFDSDGDVLLDPALLKEIIAQLLRGVKPKPAMVHVSLPGSLLRMVEMPKMDPAGLYLSLASEAERYKTFDNAEAVVDFVLVNNPGLPPNQQQLVFGAVRSDTLSQYLGIFKQLKLKAVSINIDPLATLRGMAATGVLDGLVQQVGMDAHWGVIFVEPSRVRLSVWQADRLIELRETQMETAEFAIVSQDSMVLEDLLEEISRTTKSTQPVIWLTHDMPPAMEQILSTRLNCTFRQAPLGSAVPLPQPLQLATVGAALASSVQFPFDFDIVAGLGKGSGVSAAAPGMDSAAAMSGGDGSDVAWLIPAGIACIALSGLLTAALWGISFFLGTQIPAAESQRDEVKTAVSTQEGRLDQLKKKAALDQALREQIRNSQIRNRVYLAFTQDLREKMPEKMWIYALKADNNLEMRGKATTHQSVVNFARRFDAVSYGRSIAINELKESRLHGQTVFEFTIGGDVFLNPALLGTPEEAKNTPSASSGKEMPTGDNP